MSEDILEPENCDKIETSREAVKTNLWTTLLASAERRKSAHECGASALSTLSENNEAEDKIDNTFTTIDNDGDGVMEIIDPALFDNPSNSLPSSQADSSSTVDSLKTLISRRRYRRVRARSRTHSSIDKRYAELTLIAPETLASNMDDQVSLNDSDMLIEGFAPLCRVQSRGTGYQSCSV
jgi:hypothetical protein